MSRNDLVSMSNCATYIYDSTCFSLLNDEEAHMLDNHSVVIRYKKGETIIKQGSFASNIFYIESGLVKVYIEGNAKNLILNITPANNLLGLQSVYEGNNTFPYSVSTYSPTVVRSIDVAIFKQLIRQNAAFANRIINILNEGTAQIYGRFYSLTRKQLHGRLADILLCLSNRIFKNESFELPLSRNDLGELTSMSTESVIRLMKEFKDDGLIEMKTKSIILLDIPRLHKISELG
jgi:CRP/FNR family transcriptional regulator, polysaccharide utilization system transcription regulator